MNFNFYGRLDLNWSFFIKVRNSEFWNFTIPYIPYCYTVYRSVAATGRCRTIRIYRIINLNNIFNLVDG